LGLETFSLSETKEKAQDLQNLEIGPPKLRQ